MLQRQINIQQQQQQRLELQEQQLANLQQLGTNLPLAPPSTPGSSPGVGGGAPAPEAAESALQDNAFAFPTTAAPPPTPATGEAATSVTQTSSNDSGVSPNVVGYGTLRSHFQPEPFTHSTEPMSPGIPPFPTALSAARLGSGAPDDDGANQSSVSAHMAR